MTEKRRGNLSLTSRRVVVAIHDLVMVAAAFSLAFVIRYNLELREIPLHQLLTVLPLVILAQGGVLWWSRLYRGLWRFASIPDLWNILRAAFVGGIVVALSLFMFNRLEGVPRTVLVMYPVFLVILLGTPRLIYRYWKDQALRLHAMSGNKKVLILGAGRAGEMLARDMRRDQDYVAVGFLDDDPSLHKSRIHGIPVLGTAMDLERVVRDHGIDFVIIAMPSASGEQMRRIVGICERAGVQFRTLPRLQDLMSGTAILDAVREVSIDDLLGRDPVSLDWQSIERGLTGKVVLVSGGGGSIGSELCRQIARLGPSRLIIFDHSEFNLYNIERELRNRFASLNLDVRLGSVCDQTAVGRILDEFSPQLIFHAAAYKHVPMLQFQPREAVLNNIQGTYTMAMAAVRHKVEKFILISTDKAVNPTNVMGATKRVAEILCQNLDGRSDTDFITVRFGNVLDSAGSVVPLFREQIRAGGPVTVTHPDITRYFMTIPEASQLIMQAAVMGEGGEIYVLDMGQPVKIAYLAEQMIRLSGKEPGRDIQIVYTGLRPGEKLYEELFHEKEPLRRTANDKIFQSLSRKMDWNRLEQLLERLREAAEQWQEERFLPLLMELVPEFNSTDHDFQPAKVVALKTSRPEGKEKGN